MIYRILPFLTAAILLTGCLDREDVERTLGPEGQSLDYIELLPSQRFRSAETEATEEDIAAFERLEARGEALQRETGPRPRLRDPGRELRARAAALRQRANELRAVEE